jgi:hypothetical protein
MGTVQVKCLFGDTQIKEKPIDLRPSSIFSSTVEKKEKPISTPGRVLFGDAKIRKRIEVTLDELEKYSQDKSVLLKSQQQILQTNVDELCMKYVLSWGEAIQEKNSDILNRIFSLVNSDKILQIKNEIGQLVDHLNSCELKKSGLFRSKESILESNNNKIIEIQAKSTLISQSLRFAESALEETQKINKEIDKQLIEIEPYIVTCSFFANYEKDDFPKELYISRLASLLQTKINFNSSKVAANTFYQTLVNLIDVANNTIKNEIPSWISNFLLFLTQDKSDATLLELLQQQKQTLINKLK